jgi:CCR4-NOT transcriptional regulation complex NOT5 subunit
MTDFNTERMNWLLAEIAELESQMEDTELPASEQESLLKDWRYLQDELVDVLEALEREELMADPNNWEDNREDCSRCSGCAYCMDSHAYDGSDEI